MSDDSPTPANVLEVSVSELSAKLKRTVEDTFGYVRVRGELGRISRPASGHLYLDLKDERATLSGIIWKGTAAKLAHKPEEGLEVVATGKLTTYPGQSRYQIIIDSIEPAGAGALMALLEERRKKLAAEGLFDDARKQLLPYMPQVIGVVTSPSGAVIRDILHRLSDRFPCHVLVWPVRVQGETCGTEVANGIHQLNQLDKDGPLPRPDLIIVARGGGSLEDLWGFNDEEAIRAVANSDIPLISAVGHETDWTLIDHAADWRAPTPTAAAEKAVPVKAELEASLFDLSARLRGSMTRLLDQRRNQARSAARGLTSPDMLLALPRRQFDEASGRLGRALVSSTERARTRFTHSAGRLSAESLSRALAVRRETMEHLFEGHRRALQNAMAIRRSSFDGLARQVRPTQLVSLISQGRSSLARLSDAPLLRTRTLITQKQDRLGNAYRLFESLNYNSVLSRGYAVIRDQNQKPITGIKGQKPGDGLQIEMADGSLNVMVGKTTSAAAKPTSSTKSTRSDSQGDLF